MNKRVLKVIPHSEAEDFIVRKITPNCVDEVAVRLGVLFNKPYNEYVLTENDYSRCRDLIIELRGEKSMNRNFVLDNIGKISVVGTTLFAFATIMMYWFADKKYS